jgi:hypothetical protein
MSGRRRRTVSGKCTENEGIGIEDEDAHGGLPMSEM